MRPIAHILDAYEWLVNAGRVRKTPPGPRPAERADRIHAQIRHEQATAIGMARDEVAYALRLALIGRDAQPQACLDRAANIFVEIGGHDAADRWAETTRLVPARVQVGPAVDPIGHSLGLGGSGIPTGGSR